jgi:hypothetical protein
MIGIGGTNDQRIVLPQAQQDVPFLKNTILVKKKISTEKLDDWFELGFRDSKSHLPLRMTFPSSLGR